MTAGKEPLTIYRHVSSGSSFGANPLRQTIGLAKADRVATLADRLAHERHDPGLPRHSGRPDDRDHRVRDRLQDASDPGRSRCRNECVAVLLEPSFLGSRKLPYEAECHTAKRRVSVDRRLAGRPAVWPSLVAGWLHLVPVRARRQESTASGPPDLVYAERRPIDTSGFTAILPAMEPWPRFSVAGTRFATRSAGAARATSRRSTQPSAIARRSADEQQIVLRLVKAAIYQYDADPGAVRRRSRKPGRGSRSRDALAAAVALQRHLFPGRLGDAAGRERKLHPLPRRKLVHRSHQPRRPCTPSPRARARRSGISPNTSSSFPTTSGSSGS